LSDFDLEEWFHASSDSFNKCWLTLSDRLLGILVHGTVKHTPPPEQTATSEESLTFDEIKMHEPEVANFESSLYGRGSEIVINSKSNSV
jgi:hypothetical protein